MNELTRYCLIRRFALYFVSISHKRSKEGPIWLSWCMKVTDHKTRSVLNFLCCQTKKDKVTLDLF